MMYSSVNRNGWGRRISLVVAISLMPLAAIAAESQARKPLNIVFVQNDSMDGRARWAAWCGPPTTGQPQPRCPRASAACCFATPTPTIPFAAPSRRACRRPGLYTAPFKARTTTRGLTTTLLPFRRVSKKPATSSRSSARRTTFPAGDGQGPAFGVDPLGQYRIA